MNNNESSRVVTKKPFLQRGAGKAGGVGQNTNKTPSRSLKKDALEGSGYKNNINQEYTYDQSNNQVDTIKTIEERARE